MSETTTFEAASAQDLQLIEQRARAMRAQYMARILTSAAHGVLRLFKAPLRQRTA